jgi:Na+/H+ antiporter NhaB
MALALLVLNLTDGLFTLTFLQLGVAEELNPLMRLAYERSPLLFMAFKLAIVSTGVALLCAHQGHRLASWALRAGAALYALINLYHLALR